MAPPSCVQVPKKQSFIPLTSVLLLITVNHNSTLIVLGLMHQRLISALLDSQNSQNCFSNMYQDMANSYFKIESIFLALKQSLHGRGVQPFGMGPRDSCGTLFKEMLTEGQMTV